MRNSSLVRSRILTATGLAAGGLLLNGCVALTVFDGSANSQSSGTDFSARDAQVVEIVPTSAEPLD